MFSIEDSLGCSLPPSNLISILSVNGQRLRENVRRSIGAHLLSVLFITNLTCGATVCSAQAAPAVPVSFDAASVKVSTPPFEVVSLQASRGRLRYLNATLLECIARAYAVAPSQVFGPAWIAEQRYSIDATAGKEASNDDLMKMLQSLLKDRFGLALHRSANDQMVYSLALDKKSPKLRPAVADETTEIRPTSQPGISFSFRHVSMEQFATFLSSRLIHLDRRVVNMTELAGDYDFTLQWTVDPRTSSIALDRPDELQGDPSGLTIFTAIKEQTGLRLDPKKISSDSIIVDAASRVPTEN